MALRRCVNCGLYGSKSQITEKVVKSIAVENFYKILLCMHCYNEENIVCHYGYKEEISKEEAMKFLNPKIVKETI